MPISHFAQEVLDFLKMEGVAVEQWHNTTLNTPFECLWLASGKLVLHLVSLERFLAFRPDVSFFPQLSDAFAAQQMRIIHLWEDVWRTKTTLVKSRIWALSGKSIRIHGRLCEVVRIDKCIADNFLSVNHLQVLTSSKIKYGLVIKPNYQARYALPPLVAVATFSNAKKFVRNGLSYRSFELIRFANLQGCTVVGGLDKLLQHFMKTHQPDDLMTYADRDWSDGRSYEKLGFRQIEATLPQTFYLNPHDLTRHYPHHLEVVPDEWLKICNSGSLKYLLDVKMRRMPYAPTI